MMTYSGYLMLVASDRVQLITRNVMPSAFYPVAETYCEEIMLGLSATGGYGLTLTLSLHPEAWHVFTRRGSSFVGFGFEYLRGETYSESELEEARKAMKQYCAHFVPLEAGINAMEKLRELVRSRS